MFKIVEQSPMIDYHEVMEHVEQKYGIRTRDYAGKFSVENLNAQKDHKARWLTENGYGEWLHVLDKPKGQQNDWARDSKEIAMRIEINTKYREIEDTLVEVPYQDLWHYHLERSLGGEVCRGGQNTIYLGNDNADQPQWVIELHDLIRNEVKDSPAYDPGEDSMSVMIDW